MTGFERPLRMTEQEGQLKELLDLVEANIDPEHCERVDQRYRRALAYEDVDWAPLLIRSPFAGQFSLPAPWDKFNRYPYSEAFCSPAAMLQNQLLGQVVPGLVIRDDNPLAIRNDHGTIQIASLLGASWAIREDSYPWVEALDSDEAVCSLIEEDESIDWEKGVVGQSRQTLEFYHEQLRIYPLCQEAIQISLPDLQGPIDTAEMLWGGQMLMALLDRPELARRLMDKIVQAMMAAAEYYRNFAWDKLEPFANTQHGYNIAGRLLIRDDSAIMVAPETYREVIRPHDAKLLREVGGGSIHFCGNGEHLLESMLEIPDCRGFDFGQPGMMNIKRICERCQERKTAIAGLTPSREELVSGQARRDFPTGVVHVYITTDIDDAREVVEAYKVSG